MVHSYSIEGMTCMGCAGKVKSKLLALPDVLSAEVQLDSPQATISMSRHISTSDLQAAVSTAGNYHLSDLDTAMHQHESAKQSVLQQYKPLFIIAAFITGLSLLVELQRGYFDTGAWMTHFMAGFFLVFSFFKLLDLRAFADSYAMYDIVAKRWHTWGYVYAFTELALGIAFFTGFNPLLTNAVTLLVMSISLIGVVQSVLNKRQIQCACLGAVFNLPMSSITIIEDALMILMSASMLIGMAG